MDRHLLQQPVRVLGGWVYRTLTPLQLTHEGEDALQVRRVDTRPHTEDEAASALELPGDVLIEMAGRLGLDLDRDETRPRAID